MKNKILKLDIERNAGLQSYIEAASISNVIDAETAIDKVVDSGIFSDMDKDILRGHLTTIARSYKKQHDESYAKAESDLAGVMLNVSKKRAELESQLNGLKKEYDGGDASARRYLGSDIKALESEIASLSYKDELLRTKNGWRMRYTHKDMAVVEVKAKGKIVTIGLTPSGDAYDVEYVKGDGYDLGWCASVDSSNYKVYTRTYGKRKVLSILVNGSYINLSRLMYKTFINHKDVPDNKFSVLYDNWLFIAENFAEVKYKRKKVELPSMVYPYGYKDSENNGSNDSVISEMAQLFASWNVVTVDKLIEVTGMDRTKYLGVRGNVGDKEAFDLLVRARARRIRDAKTKQELESLIGEGYQQKLDGKDIILFRGGLCAEIRGDGSIKVLDIIDVDGVPYYKGLPRVSVARRMAKAFLTTKQTPAVDTVTDQRLTVIGNYHVRYNDLTKK